MHLAKRLEAWSGGNENELSLADLPRMSRDFCCCISVFVSVLSIAGSCFGIVTVSCTPLPIHKKKVHDIIQ